MLCTSADIAEKKRLAQEKLRLKLQNQNQAGNKTNKPPVAPKGNENNNNGSASQSQQKANSQNEGSKFLKSLSSIQMNTQQNRVSLSYLLSLIAG